MKPLGPIPAGYAAIDGELAIGGARVSHWAEQAEKTPLFVYSKELIAQRFADLRAAEGSVHAATHKAMIARLEALPPEQRRAMADMLARGPERDRRNRRNSRPPKD